MTEHRIYGDSTATVKYASKPLKKPIAIDCDSDLSLQMAKSLGWALITACKDYERFTERKNGNEH